MKKVVQILIDNKPPSEWFINGWKKWADKVIFLNHETEYNPEITIVSGSRFYSPFFQKVMKNRNPYFAINRPYLGAHNTKIRNQWRVSVNSFAPIFYNNPPYDRWDKIKLEKHPWKVKEIKNILVATTFKGTEVFIGVKSHTWAKYISDYFVNQDVDLKIRYKEQQGKGKGGRYLTLWNDLDWADLVISYSSAITAEAFWYGKKVISTGVCPTWICNTSKLLNMWDDPTEPKNRDQWHNHMSWIQFSNDEWESGEAQEMTVAYQGWPPDVSHITNGYL